MPLLKVEFYFIILKFKYIKFHIIQPTLAMSSFVSFLLFFVLTLALTHFISIYVNFSYLSQTKIFFKFRINDFLKNDLPQ